MERYTEYHNGIAVIRDKSKLKEAMQKLASYEDVEDYSDMEKITTEFAEYICDKLCKYPCIYDQEELDEYCAECKMAEFICGICNCYNKLNTFVGSQLEKIMIENNRLKNELQDYRNLEEQGLLLRLPCKVGDAVYSCECGRIVRDFVYSFSTDANGLWAINMYGGIIGLFGLSVFTTLAEAEKKLAEMKGE